MSVCGEKRMRLSWRATMARPGAGGNAADGFSKGIYRGFCKAYREPIDPGPNQLFKKDLIFLSNSSNDVSPLIFSPLIKKVGVEFTFNTSAAYF